MAEYVIEIENLVKRYKELVALDHLNLAVKEGEVFGLLGPNGSGKTTAISCILSLLQFDKGSVKVFGTEMQPDSYDSKRPSRQTVGRPQFEAGPGHEQVGQIGEEILFQATFLHAPPPLPALSWAAAAAAPRPASSAPGWERAAPWAGP